MQPATSTSSSREATIETLLAPIGENRFLSDIRSLHALFCIYAATSPEPLPAPGLIITPEIRAQCERHLPIAKIITIFNRLYSSALTYPPILSSTPFHRSLSWADTFASLPQDFQFSANPARLLEALLSDNDLMTRFLFTSFLPKRFYGLIGRYPDQQLFIREWLKATGTGRVSCLDAACGTGEETYELANLLCELGFSPDNVQIDGWTLEPLEVWVATHRSLPHDRNREMLLRKTTAPLLQRGYGRSIHFRCIDLTRGAPYAYSPEMAAENGGQFNLILCNGLLGGPIIHESRQLEQTVANLVQLLAPGGIMLAADSFHGGWKQKCPQWKLRASFEANGLRNVEISEGICGLKPY